MKESFMIFCLIEYSIVLPDFFFLIDYYIVLPDFFSFFFNNILLFSADRVNV